MRRSKFAGWALTMAIAVAALSAMAQEEGPILLPKPKPAVKPISPTLLVMCDLACSWKLDGKARGAIAAGDSATAKVELGEHIVIAATEDGLDKVQQITEVKAAGQKILILELQPVREARLKAEQEKREKAEKEVQELARLAWTDPATGLTWAKEDNGRDVNWQQAMDYCRNLQLAGHSDWRLPTIDELQGIYDPSVSIRGQCCDGMKVIWHVKGNLQLSGGHWSSSYAGGSNAAFAWKLYFGDGIRTKIRLSDSGYRRALCVRRSGE